MSLVEHAPERIDVRGGFIYNQFPTLRLGEGFQVVVHSLALADEADDNLTSLFDLRVERVGRKIRQARITAHCIAPVCGNDQKYLINPDGSPSTDPFTPREGLDLNNGRYLPDVLAHSFGAILNAVAMGTDPGFYEEIRSHTEVGIVTRT